MSVVRVETEISFDKLLKAVEQLNLTDLEELRNQIIALEAKRKAPCFSKDESRLMLKISQGVPPETRRRFNELVAKRREEKITPDEHQELLHLTNLIEISDAERMRHIADLAQIRGVSVETLMKDLGIFSAHA
jgi:hypothetical protein